MKGLADLTKPVWWLAGWLSRMPPQRGDVKKAEGVRGRNMRAVQGLCLFNI